MMTPAGLFGRVCETDTSKPITLLLIRLPVVAVVVSGLTCAVTGCILSLLVAESCNRCARRTSCGELLLETRTSLDDLFSIKACEGGGGGAESRRSTPPPGLFPEIKFASGPDGSLPPPM